MIKAIIEIPKGSNYKYEVDKDTGRLVLDRVISLKYPASYGYIPETLELDGDPLDLFVISSKKIPPLTIIKCNIHGAFICTDNGIQDNKLIATLDGEEHALSLLPKINTFLCGYKEGFIVHSYESKEIAESILKKATEDFILNTIRQRFES